MDNCWQNEDDLITYTKMASRDRGIDRWRYSSTAGAITIAFVHYWRLQPTSHHLALLELLVPAGSSLRSWPRVPAHSALLNRDPRDFTRALLIHICIRFVLYAKV